jgi:hypothetical protein
LEVLIEMQMEIETEREMVIKREESRWRFGLRWRLGLGKIWVPDHKPRFHLPNFLFWLNIT